MVRIEQVRAGEGFEVFLRFTDSTEAVVDLESLLEGPVFEPLRRDREQFAAVRVDPELGTVVWPNGADLCPDVLYMRATGKRPEDLFPSLAAGVEA